LVERLKDCSPRVRIYLLELDLMVSYRLAIAIKNEEARAGGAIVDGPNESL
jgi:hypothetical protein